MPKLATGLESTRPLTKRWARRTKISAL